ncbi:MAG: HU family DNA-binding protein [Bacteroidaceae bacterium]|nr:HU family DNA-binding protein [Bacteroidaceae bacterium]
MGMMYRRAKVRLTYREEKPEVFKLRQLTYPQVSYEQLCGMIQIVGVNKAQTKAVVDALLQALVHYMELGHGVSLGQFGSFKPTFNSKTARSLKETTLETVKVKKIQFYPGGAFKEMLSNLSMEENEPVSLQPDPEP